jgi:hypothetical protein
MEPRRLFAVAAVLVITSARRGDAQNEAALRAAFEGKVVSVKIDMPATSEGVDVYPQASMPVDFRKVADRLKDKGTALKIGQQIMVTKVVVKKEHIEFQLGGGGYGTFGDWMSSPSNVGSTSEGESNRERALKDSIKAAKGPTKRKQFERELSSIRADRERENAKAKAEAQQANALNEANLRVRRMESGSRFNIRFKNSIPTDALMPQGVMTALAPYVDFATASAAQPSAPTANALSSLKKGLTLKEVEALLGPAATASETKEGAITVLKRTYKHSGMKVEASFVGDVLVDFTITPQ